ncbi:MAG: hypothetical protein GBAus27B_000251 [Mycoplasmataceae bacterium]|nr:MAG: hypothetical protein GBAus27B_000251 [Mycoplasmataceae bacterium]
MNNNQNNCCQSTNYITKFLVFVCQELTQSQHRTSPYQNELAIAKKENVLNASLLLKELQAQDQLCSPWSFASGNLTNLNELLIWKLNILPLKIAKVVFIDKLKKSRSFAEFTKRVVDNHQL